MLDRLMVGNNATKDLFTREYRPAQAVTRYKLVNPTGQNLCIVFPPWHGGGAFYEILIKRLVSRGNAVLAYYFHDEILKPDAEQVTASFAHIRDSVSKQLAQVTTRGHYSKTELIAMSLGNPALSIATSRFTDFDSATMVVGASSLAKSMWHGSRTQHIRAGIEQQGYDLQALELAWADMAPINHIGALVGKNISLIISETDEVIPTMYQKEFLQAVVSAGIEPTVQMTQLGHYATIGRYCVIGNI